MRETMQSRLMTAMPDRKAIEQFLDWLEQRTGGKLVTLLPSGTTQDVMFCAELDTFYNIDRDRLAAEDTLYGPLKDYQI